MKFTISVNQEELELLTQFTAWGWLNIPKNVQLVPEPAAAPAPPTPPTPAVVVQPPEPTAPPEPAPPTPPAVGKGGFDAAFQFVIKWEGSAYEDNSGDPGGPTKYGIDTKDDSEYWKALGVTDLHDLTLAQAEDIYRTKYWTKNLCDTMPTPLAETHFNYCVNVGASQSVKFMQAALGVTVDGQYGPVTEAAVKALVSPYTNHAANLMVDHADDFYKGLAQKPNFAQFLKGWLNRNADLRLAINSWS